jgi:hypothetical protein
MDGMNGDASRTNLRFKANDVPPPVTAHDARAGARLGLRRLETTSHFPNMARN